MKKVFQTNTSLHRGNCAQAVVASLFELPLEMVPDFIKWHKYKNLLSKGFTMNSMEFNFFKLMGTGYSMFEPVTISETLGLLNLDKGINGYWYATVPSMSFPDEDVYHAVVINDNMKVVHDPNPNQLALKARKKDIVSIVMNGCGKYWDYTGQDENGLIIEAL